MSTTWSTIKLGKLLRRAEVTVQPIMDAEYREITVRLWGKGVIERGRTVGSVLSGRRFVAHAGQFIVSRIDARNGAMGIVPDSLEGALVTNDFPLFDVNTDRLDPAFLGWLSKTEAFVELCRRASEGTTNRVRLKEERFSALEIPLPPPPEQRRIVARIEELVAQIREAKMLRDQAVEEREAVWPSILNETLLATNKLPVEYISGDTAEDLLASAVQRHVAFKPFGNNNAHPNNPTFINKASTDLPSGWAWTTLGSVLTHLIDCVNDTPDFADTDTGLLGLKSTNIRPYRLDLSQRWFMSPADFARWNRREMPIAGDVILTREAPMGNACMLPPGINVCLTQRLMLLRADQQIIEPTLLLHFLNSPIFQDQVREHCRGLTTPHIRVQDAPNLLIPLPPKQEQQQIVRYLDQVQAEIDDLAQLQTETAAELDALLPSILNKAFNGAL
jgi:type I restriction enzyme S subunit